MTYDIINGEWDSFINDDNEYDLIVDTYGAWFSHDYFSPDTGYNKNFEQNIKNCLNEGGKFYGCYNITWTKINGELQTISPFIKYKYFYRPCEILRNGDLVGPSFDKIRYDEYDPNKVYLLGMEPLRHLYLLSKSNS